MSVGSEQVVNRVVVLGLIQSPDGHAARLGRNRSTTSRGPPRAAAARTGAARARAPCSRRARAWSALWPGVANRSSAAGQQTEQTEQASERPGMTPATMRHVTPSRLRGACAVAAVIFRALLSAMSAIVRRDRLRIHESSRTFSAQKRVIAKL